MRCLLQLLQRCRHFRDLGEILESCLGPWAFGKRPQISQFIGRHTAASIGDTEDYMLRRMTDENLDRRELGGGGMAVNGSLYRVSEKFADDIFDVGEDIGEGCVKMALNLNLGDVG